MQEPDITLVLGGARSGKSRLAERLTSEAAAARAARRVYIATAQALDAEMAARIDRHQAERGPGWATREVPFALADAIRAAGPEEVVLVDCLTLWLSNRLCALPDPLAADVLLEPEVDDLLDAISQARTSLILVSNEVGLGLVPETPLGRAFRDCAGRLNQRMASIAHRVAFVAAGLPLWLKRC